MTRYRFLIALVTAAVLLMTAVLMMPACSETVPQQTDTQESADDTRSGVSPENFTPPLRHNVVSNPTVVQSPHPSGL